MQEGFYILRKLLAPCRKVSISSESFSHHAGGFPYPQKASRTMQEGFGIIAMPPPLMFLSGNAVWRALCHTSTPKYFYLFV